MSIAKRQPPSPPKGFLCLYPIGGMVGYANGPDLVSMDGVRFARTQVVSRDWKALGFGFNPVASMNERAGMELEDCDVLAIVELPGTETDTRTAAAARADKALRYLLSCNPAWDRDEKRRPVMPGLSSIKLSGFHFVQQLPTDTQGRIEWHSNGPLHEIRLDGFWPNNSKSGFYKELNVLLGRTRSVWEEKLVAVSSLLGAARLATTPWECFFHSMVGIEKLLKKRSEQWNAKVPPALETLFGWLSFNRGARYAEALRKLYKLRNGLVHDGRTLEIEHRHAQLADEVLFNSLSLGFRHLGRGASLRQLLKDAELVAHQKANGEAPTALHNALVVHR